MLGKRKKIRLIFINALNEGMYLVDLILFLKD